MTAVLRTDVARRLGTVVRDVFGLEQNAPESSDFEIDLGADSLDCTAGDAIDLVMARLYPRHGSAR